MTDNLRSDVKAPAHPDSRPAPGHTVATSPDAIGAQVSVTIDGIEAKVPFGMTILDAAKNAGVDDPDAVPPPRPQRRRRVPHVRRGGRGPAHAAARLRLPDRQRR